ncbi:MULTISPECIES: hypothetical protein [Streptomyces]|uniref:DUF1059 domain-containing protein n=1 Tax=Streptomyces dengpaensis TaxID=2049881 RepID=A0ABM6SJK8_9ACTN|nr:MULTISPECIES: hypothetical protein [Streptomyces]AVH54699.1 hypothetical protein C4B68_01395 [Streptomyces dengpaensis]PIA98544.1 hypothetical protein B1C81_39550 [Streptomyces sp. HG99]
MTISITCTNCHQEITGQDEDDLVPRVQAHVADHARAQGHEHTPTREQILTRLRRRRAAPDAPSHGTGRRDEHGPPS